MSNRRPRFEIEGELIEVGIDGDGDHVAHVAPDGWRDGDLDDRVGTYAIVLDEEQTRALGAHLYKRVRITLEVIE